MAKAKSKASKMNSQSKRSPKPNTPAEQKRADNMVANSIAAMKGEPPVYVGPAAATQQEAKVPKGSDSKKAAKVKSEKFNIHVEGLVVVAGVLAGLGAAPKEHLDAAVRFDRVRVGTYFVDIAGKKVGKAWLKSGNTSGLQMVCLDLTPRTQEEFVKSVPSDFGKKERFGKKTRVIPLAFELALSRPQFNPVGMNPSSSGHMSG